jgi:hypothetical protein
MSAIAPIKVAALLVLALDPPSTLGGGREAESSCNFLCLGTMPPAGASGGGKLAAEGGGLSG